MWLLTIQGFYSVVAHRENPDVVLVRGRVRADLEALKAQIPGLDVFEDPTADYRWRAEVTRAEWTRAASELAASVDYDNFKNAVARWQGQERHDIYSEVWAVLTRLAGVDGRSGQ